MRLRGRLACACRARLSRALVWKHGGRARSRFNCVLAGRTSCTRPLKAAPAAAPESWNPQLESRGYMPRQRGRPPRPRARDAWFARPRRQAQRSAAQNIALLKRLLGDVAVWTDRVWTESCGEQARSGAMICRSAFLPTIHPNRGKKRPQDSGAFAGPNLTRSPGACGPLRQRMT